MPQVLELPVVSETPEAVHPMFPPNAVVPALDEVPLTTQEVRESRPARLWIPRRVVFTPMALEEPWGQRIYQRVQALGLPIEEATANRITGVRGVDERETYRNAKSTLAVVTAPPSQFKLQPIPPSADWQFHIAEGCPAHCQYCYLAGSLTGPPLVRVFANVPKILDNLTGYLKQDCAQSFEVSCYTDPLGIEHLTGSLAECIRWFGQRPGAQLRYVSKFDAVDSLVGLEHDGNTRPRTSINIPDISRRFEGGVSPVANRIAALCKLALPREEGGGGYPVGFVIAPIMPLEGWQEAYATLLDDIAAQIDFPCDLTFELITHRFTPGSKEVIRGWYPQTGLDLDEATRERKLNKFGGTKYVYPKTIMKDIRAFFEREIAARFPQAQILYFT